MKMYALYNNLQIRPQWVINSQKLKILLWVLVRFYKMKRTEVCIVIAFFGGSLSTKIHVRLQQYLNVIVKMLKMTHALNVRKMM